LFLFRIQLYASNQQSIETTIPVNSNKTEQSFMRSKRNSTVNSLFSPSRSATSSVIEINDVDQTEDNNNNDVDLFPTLNTISPRLTMQFSNQQQ
jgi:hypothetical protein